MEENPLKDLSNEYTARCLMVIAKELGMDKDYDTEQIQLMSDMLMVDVEKQEGKGAVKMKLSDLVSYDDVHTKLDALMERRVSSAREKGCVPRHISTIDVKTGKIEVSIVDVPFTHIYATTPPSCECVRFFTENLKEFPLVVQGPSAGIDSTASALLAELLRLMQNKIGVRPGNLSRTRSSVYIG